MHITAFLAGPNQASVLGSELAAIDGGQKAQIRAASVNCRDGDREDADGIDGFLAIHSGRQDNNARRGGDAEGVLVAGAPRGAAGVGEGNLLSSRHSSKAFE